MKKIKSFNIKQLFDVCEAAHYLYSHRADYDPNDDPVQLFLDIDGVRIVECMSTPAETIYDIDVERIDQPTDMLDEFGLSDTVMSFRHYHNGNNALISLTTHTETDHHDWFKYILAEAKALRQKLAASSLCEAEEFCRALASLKPELLAAYRIIYKVLVEDGVYHHSVWVEGYKVLTSSGKAVSETAFLNDAKFIDCPQLEKLEDFISKKGARNV